MRPLAFVVGTALLLAGGLNSLWAQRSSGHSSGGRSGGSSFGSHSFSASSRYSSAVPTSGFTGINRGALSTRPYRSPYRGLGYGTPYLYYSPYYFDPYLDYGDSSYYSNGPWQSDPQPAYPDGGAYAAPAEPVYPPPTYYSRPPYNAPPLLPEDETPSSPPLTLILRDGKQLQLKSYAVMGENIWDFSGQTGKRIALASVNLDASRKATEASGGEFPEIR